MPLGWEGLTQISSNPGQDVYFHLRLPFQPTPEQNTLIGKLVNCAACINHAWDGRQILYLKMHL